MLKLITVRQIKFFMNGLIIFVLIMGSGTILTNSYELFFKTDEIDILRVDVPWNRPIEPVTVMFDKNVLQNDPALLQKLNTNIFAYDLIERFVFLTLMVLILIQLKKLIMAIRGKTFFKLPNILIIRNLAIIVGIWVLSNFTMYQLIPFFFPVDLITESINLVTINESLLGNILVASDFKMLFVAVILYVISVLFKEGYQLKEQTDLTI
jgi:hypothetical protein